MYCLVMATLWSMAEWRWCRLLQWYYIYLISSLVILSMLYMDIVIEGFDKTGPFFSLEQNLCIATLLVGVRLEIIVGGLYCVV